jgi:hypothetical protein
MTTRLRLRRDDLSWRELDDELIVLDLTKSKYLMVNDTGAVIWHRLADGATEAELVQAVVDAFEVEPAQAEADVRSFVETLEGRGLVERSPL